MSLRTSDLRRINQAFEVFGRNAAGMLRLRWVHTSELFYFVESTQAKPKAVHLDPEGKKQKTVAMESVKTIYLVEDDWTRHSWVGRFANMNPQSKGLGYVVCILRDPIPRELHVARYGKKSPWDKQGSYEPIENTFRPDGDWPNERNTALLKNLLLQMFEAGADPSRHPALQRTQKSKQIFDALLEQHQHKEKQTVDRIMDEIDDIYPAFGKAVPGTRSGGVSIGGI